MLLRHLREAAFDLAKKKAQEKREKGVSQLAMLRGNQFRNFANSRPNSANARPL
jgi:hypothetical protein